MSSEAHLTAESMKEMMQHPLVSIHHQLMCRIDPILRKYRAVDFNILYGSRSLQEIILVTDLGEKFRIQQTISLNRRDVAARQISSYVERVITMFKAGI